MILEEAISPLCKISDTGVAEVLLDPAQRRYLTPFLGQACSVPEAARALDMKPNSLLYQVKKLITLGLIVLVRLEPRRGRPLHLYRTVADRFFIPFEVTSAATFEDLHQEMTRRTRQAFSKHYATVLHSAPAFGVLLQRRADGDVEWRLSPDGSKPFDVLSAEIPAVHDLWFAPQLDYVDAKELQHELERLFERFSLKDGARPYLVHLAMTPVKP